MNYTSKVTIGVATGGLLLSAFATSAFAGYDGSNNNHDSGKKYHSDYEKRTDVNQKYYNDWDNKQSRHNGSNDNWKKSGDHNSYVSVKNHSNYNYANVGGYNGDNEYKDGYNKHDGKKQHDNNYSNDYYPHEHYTMAWLSGHEEVPGPGDTDGKGKAQIHVDPESDNVCAMVKVKNIATATGAHIHHGEKGVAGPVVVTLPTPDANGYAEGCVTVSDDLSNKMLENPHHYYVNVHNEEFPDGAVRGQLSM